jgi:hypothetical protein
VPINPIIRTRTRYFRHSYPPARDNMGYIYLYNVYSKYFSSGKYIPSYTRVPHEVRAETHAFSFSVGCFSVSTKRETLVNFLPSVRFHEVSSAVFELLHAERRMDKTVMTEKTDSLLHPSIADAPQTNIFGSCLHINCSSYFPSKRAE